MSFNKKRSSLIFLPLIVILMVFSLYLSTLAALPDTLTLSVGEEYMLNFKAPFYLKIMPDDEQIINLFKSSSAVKAEKRLGMSTPLSVICKEDGASKIDVSFLGFVPVKSIDVLAIPQKKIMVCGNTVGVKINVKGILVVGLSGVLQRDGKEVHPARDTGISAGDFIVEVNDKQIEKISQLIAAIDESKGKSIKIKYVHENVYSTVNVTPAVAVDDNKQHIGLWVRDSTAGIGTMTFFDPETRKFGALGHGITDIDTGTIMPVGDGEILHSNINGIKKGIQGSPGELKGEFLEENDVLGELELNCEYGVYGTIYKEKARYIHGDLYPVGLRTSIVTGPAKILSNIQGEAVKEYDIFIEKITRRAFAGPKSMVIRITDPELLNSTGGIVQGMSGSPIVQNGRIIGAVTHVLVNDPSKGYGIFIEYMLDMVR